MTVAVIVLAAGSGSRMGADKLSLRLGERSILGHSLRAYDGHGFVQRILVARPELTLPPEAEGWQVVINRDPTRGMGSSLRAGVAVASPTCEAFLLGLGDLPALRNETVARVIEHGMTCSEGMAFPTWQGRRGHPVWLQSHFRPALLAARGDQGGRALLQDSTGAAVAVDDPGAVLDVDTPEDLARLHAIEDGVRWCVGCTHPPEQPCP
jgi:molybdenum cofactor cytidylyltransferase